MPAKKPVPQTAKGAPKSKTITAPEQPTLPKLKVGRWEIVNGEPRWMVPVGAITPDPANTNRHSEKSLNAIKGSVARFGQLKPLVLTKDLIIQAGNGTYEAMLQLEKSEVWCTQSGLSGTEAALFGIADNRTAVYADPDAEAIQSILRAADSEGVELMGLGFSEDDIAILIADAADGDGPPAGTDDPNRRGNTPEAEEQNFLSSGVRQLAFYVKTEDYDTVVGQLDTIMKAMALDSHSDVFLTIVARESARLSAEADGADQS